MLWMRSSAVDGALGVEIVFDKVAATPSTMTRASGEIDCRCARVLSTAKKWIEGSYCENGECNSWFPLNKLLLDPLLTSLLSFEYDYEPQTTNNPSRRWKAREHKDKRSARVHEDRGL